MLTKTLVTKRGKIKKKANEDKTSKVKNVLCVNNSSKGYEKSELSKHNVVALVSSARGSDLHSKSPWQPRLRSPIVVISSVAAKHSTSPQSQIFFSSQYFSGCVNISSDNNDISAGASGAACCRARSGGGERPL